MKYQTREGRLKKLVQERARQTEARKEAREATMRVHDYGLLTILFRNLDRMQGGWR